jgi:DUF1365 family protein
MYLDLAELPYVLDPYLLWSARGPACAWFRREDHFGAKDESLDLSVRREVQRQTGRRPEGPIRLLTNLRYFGFVINPVSYFYCFNAETDRLETVLAEVHNTPWGETHCYVLNAPVNPGKGGARALWIDKEFHVSPFMNMTMRYRWHLTEPGDRISVHIENHPKDEFDRASLPAGPKASRPFDVTLTMKREEITAASLRRILLRHPCMTAKVAAGIYWQALKLWWKQVPFVPHPKKQTPTSNSGPSNMPEIFPNRAI